MGLRCLKIRKMAKKDSNRKNIISRRVESNVKRELLSKLGDILSEYEQVEIEVSPGIVGEFINVLDGDITNKYDYVQIDDTKYIFRNKEIVF